MAFPPLSWGLSSPNVNPFPNHSSSPFTPIQPVQCFDQQSNSYVWMYPNCQMPQSVPAYPKQGICASSPPLNGIPNFLNQAGPAQKITNPLVTDKRPKSKSSGKSKNKSATKISTPDCDHLTKDLCEVFSVVENPFQALVVAQNSSSPSQSVVNFPPKRKNPSKASPEIEQGTTDDDEPLGKRFTRSILSKDQRGMEKEKSRGQMREVQLGCHTVRSHGFHVARTHMHDWLILFLLVAIEIGLNVIHPFYRFVGKDMMTDLKYPLKSNTIPILAVPGYALLLPIVIFLFIYYRRRCVYDLHHSVLGICFSFMLTGVITDAIKDAVGRPRPDFFWRCFPDGKDVYDELGNVVCHGIDSVIKEGHKSFPSGHTSWSFAGLNFLSLYLSGKIKVFDRRGHIAKLCVMILPLLMACLVGISRVDDYWHHWQDVFAGGILGVTVSTFCYLQFFPPPYSAEGWGPYAYFHMLEERARQANAVIPLNAQFTEVQVMQQPNRQNTSRSFKTHDSLDEMESGRR